MELKDYTTEELRAELKKRNAEERAILNLEYERDFLGNDLSENMVRRAYITGCYAQKAIDVEKAKNAFRSACGWLSTYLWYNEVFDEFMKNMEE